MSPCWKFRMKPLMGGFVIAFIQFAGMASGAAAAVLPDDPCALLKPAEIQTLAPNAKIGSGVTKKEAPLAVSCTYVWGPRTPGWGETSLSVQFIDASKIWAGSLSSDEIKQRVLVEIKNGGPHASPISGIGEGGVFTFNTSKRKTAKGDVLTTGDAVAKAYLVKAKGLIVLAILHDGSDALTRKDQVIALLKNVVGKL